MILFSVETWIKTLIKTKTNKESKDVVLEFSPFLSWPERNNLKFMSKNEIE